MLLDINQFSNSMLRGISASQSRRVLIKPRVGLPSHTGIISTIETFNNIYHFQFLYKELLDFARRILDIYIRYQISFRLIFSIKNRRILLHIVDLIVKENP